MNQFVDYLNRWSDQWATLVFHASWQGATVGLLVLAVVTLGKRISAPVRYTLLLLALVKFLIPTTFASPFGVFGRPSLEPVSPASASLEPALGDGGRSDLSDTRPVGDPSIGDGPFAAVPAVEGEVRSQPESRSVANGNKTKQAGPSLSTTILTTVGHMRLAAWLMVLHLSGCVLLLAGFVLRIRQLRELMGKPVADDLRIGNVRELAERLGIKRLPSLFVSSQSRVPFSTGALRPAIVIPKHLIEQLNKDQLEVVLLHELAHHRRRDAWIAWLQVVVTTFWWFHPVVWLLHRSLQTVREECCDDLLLSRKLVDCELYCKTLFRVALTLAERNRVPSALAVSMAGGYHPLAERMKRIMDDRLSRADRLGWVGAGAVVVAAALLLPGGRQSGDAVAQQPSDLTNKINEPESEIVIRPGFDRDGDAIPAGARTRLGTERFHVPLFAINYCLQGTRIVAVSEQRHQLRIFDAQTGKIIRDITTDDDRIDSFCLHRDGQTATTLGHTFDSKFQQGITTIREWDLRGGQELTTVTLIDSPRTRSQCITLGPDSNLLYLGGNDGVVRAIHRDSGKELKRYQVADRGIKSMAVSFDGSQLAACTSDFAYLWKAGEENKIVELVDRDDLDGVLFSPDGSRLAVFGNRIGVQLWSVENRQVLWWQEIDSVDNQSVRAAFFPGGKTLATISDRSKMIILYDIETGKETRRIPINASGLQSITISPDAKNIAGAAGSSIWTFELEGTQWKSMRPAHSSFVVKVVFSNDAKRVVTSGSDQTIRVWDSDTGQQSRLISHGGRFSDIDLTKDGRLIVSNSVDDTLRLWEAETGREIYNLPGHGRFGVVPTVAFSPDERRFASWGNDLFLRVWDVATGKALIEHDLSEEFDLSALRMIGRSLGHGTFTADLSYLLIPDGRQDLIVVDVSTGATVNRIPISVRLPPFIAGAPDGKQILLSGWGEAVKMLDIPTGKEVWSLPVPKYVLGPVAFSGDGKRMAAGLRNPANKILVWDVATKQELLSINTAGISFSQWSMAFSSNGQLLAIGCEDGNVLIWDVDSMIAKRDSKP